MGGALSKPGNITPLAEFNIYADAVAAARVFALTSPIPDSVSGNPLEQFLPPKLVSFLLTASHFYARDVLDNPSHRKRVAVGSENIETEPFFKTVSN